MASPQKVKAYVSRITRYGDAVALIRLVPERRCRFIPGQFLHLALDPYDPSFNWPESRVFSIASSPLHQECLEILIAQKGHFTSRIMTGLKEHDEVWIKLPYGVFNFSDSAGSDCILIAGGTGISPFISFLKYALDTRPRYNSLKLFYGVRNTGLIIFEELFTRCSETLEKFEISVFVENLQGPADGKMFSGILPVAQIVDNTKTCTDPVYYLSGPKGMITAFNDELKRQGIPDEYIFYDKWE